MSQFLCDGYIVYRMLCGNIVWNGWRCGYIVIEQQRCVSTVNADDMLACRLAPQHNFGVELVCLGWQLIVIHVMQASKQQALDNFIHAVRRS